MAARRAGIGHRTGAGRRFQHARAGRAGAWCPIRPWRRGLRDRLPRMDSPWRAQESFPRVARGRADTPRGGGWRSSRRESGAGARRDGAYALLLRGERDLTRRDEAFGGDAVSRPPVQDWTSHLAGNPRTGSRIAFEPVPGAGQPLRRALRQQAPRARGTIIAAYAPARMPEPTISRSPCGVGSQCANRRAAWRGRLAPCRSPGRAGNPCAGRERGAGTRADVDVTPLRVSTRRETRPPRRRPAARTRRSSPTGCA